MLSISSIVKKTGHHIFINILTVIGVSILWSIFIVPAIFLFPFPVAILFLFITFIPTTVAVFALINSMLRDGKNQLRRFFKLYFYYFKRAFLIGVVYCLAVIIPVSEWWYYFTINHNYFVFIFAIFQTYLCLTFLASQVYTIPFLVMEDLSAIQAMNQSIKHFLGHTWYTIGLFVQILSVTILLSLTVIGFFILYIGIMSIFVLNAAQNVTLDKKQEIIVANVEQHI